MPIGISRVSSKSKHKLVLVYSLGLTQNQACVARGRGVDGLDGRLQAYKGELSTVNAQPRKVGLDFHAKQEA